MTNAQRRYVRTEMIVAAIINAVLSIVFTLIVFGGKQMVPVGGRSGLIVDAAPQTLTIAMMSMLVPTLLTRKRVACGRIAPLPGPSRWPSNVLIRSMLIAVVAVTIALVLHRTFMPLAGSSWPFSPTVIFKATYGAILGAAISGYAVVKALAD